jgi:hypothetical protein
MFAIHSFATHSSASAFRPALRRYDPDRLVPPIAAHDVADASMRVRHAWVSVSSSLSPQS